MPKDTCQILSAYHAQAVRDINCSDEILSGRAAVSDDLRAMVAKYKSIEVGIEKERRSPYCDAKYIKRCEQIMAKLEQVLNGKGIKVR